jgi:copper-containing nitrite reductase
LIHTMIQIANGRAGRSLGWVAALALFATAGLTAQAAKAVPMSTIVRNPSDLPPPVGNRAAEVVRVPLTAQEVVAALDPAKKIYYRYWTFNGKVPGPMIRVRVGDTVELTLTNPAANTMVHSIDVHAAFGPGGGAALMQVIPGTSKTFTFVAKVPGLFVYHCGTPEIADHIANGMFGMILVEPPGGLPKVDHEYYIMQSEIYTTGKAPPGQPLTLDEASLLAERPRYYVFNGAVGSLTTQFPLHAKVGQSVRIFFGNAGPNSTSSPHMVGEIFTRYYTFGSLSSPPLEGVQTATMPPGDAGIFELKARMPGQFVFVDHAIARVQQGLAAFMNVTGADVAHLMYAGPPAGVAATPSAALAITPQDAAAGAAPPLNAVIAPPPPAPALAITPEDAAGAAAKDALPASPTPAPAMTMPMPAPAAVPGTPQAAAALKPAAAAAEVRALKTYLGALGANAHYAQAMFRTWRQHPRAVPAAWRDIFRTFTSPPPAGGFAMQPAGFVAGSAAKVLMTDSAFVPSVLQIQAGQTVTWVNTSSTIHTVVDDVSRALNPGDVSLPAGAQAFASSFLLAGQNYAHTFSRPGVYHYVCTQHEHNGMVGTIVVRPAGQEMAAVVHRRPARGHRAIAHRRRWPWAWAGPGSTRGEPGRSRSRRCGGSAAAAG